MSLIDTSPPSLPERLKNETRSLHETLEQDLPIFRPEFGIAEYQRLLAAFYGFYQPVEEAFSGTPGLEEALPDWPTRLKRKALQQDLRALGLSDEEILRLPVCTQPEFKEAAEAMGCLYVLEGSTLGGQLISRHLARHLDLEFTNGASFFLSYSELVGPMWMKFRGALQALPIEQHEQTIAAANQTFAAIHRWLKQCGVVEPPDLTDKRP